MGPATGQISAPSTSAFGASVAQSKRLAVCTCVYLFVGVYQCVCVCVYMRVCVSVCVCTCVCVYVYTCVVDIIAHFPLPGGDALLYQELPCPEYQQRKATGETDADMVPCVAGKCIGVTANSAADAKCADHEPKQQQQQQHQQQQHEGEEEGEEGAMQHVAGHGKSKTKEESKALGTSDCAKPSKGNAENQKQQQQQQRLMLLAFVVFGAVLALGLGFLMQSA